MAVLVLAEHDNNELKRATLHAVTAATQLEGDVHLLVAGANSLSVAETATAIPGVTKVLHAEDSAYAHGLAENIAPLLVQLAKGYDYLLACATTLAKMLCRALQRCLMWRKYQKFRVSCLLIPLLGRPTLAMPWRL